ncbi:unnamed protein product [Ilex paraguariensis]|uniref:Uncharacterized protein n=1 Tax=Ilex paraguariensis TaxID=185542 RepID=A0ABC8UNF8_9AQUA
MAETSRSQVTITLGRSGQVVKRAGPALDNSFSDSQPAVGSKRSVRDRLGNNVDSTTQINSKRQRGDGSKLSLNAAQGVDDMHLGRDDLRYKILRKNVLRHTQSNDQQTGMDLRQMLSRPAQPSTTSLGTQHRILEPRDARQHVPEPKEIRQHLPEPKEVRQRMPELNSGSLLGRVPSMRSAEAFPLIDSMRNSYSPWTLDRLRRRSPDGVLGSSRALSMGTSRGLSPSRREEELYRKPLSRTYDDVRTAAYLSKEVSDFSRPMRAASFMTSPALPAGYTKPVPPLLAAPPPVSNIQKSSYRVNEKLTVDSLLQSLGLQKYAIYFKAEEVCKS